MLKGKKKKKKRRNQLEMCTRKKTLAPNRKGKEKNDGSAAESCDFWTERKTQKQQGRVNTRQVYKTDEGWVVHSLQSLRCDSGTHSKGSIFGRFQQGRWTQIAPNRSTPVPSQADASSFFFACHFPPSLSTKRREHPLLNAKFVAQTGTFGISFFDQSIDR